MSGACEFLCDDVNLYISSFLNISDYFSFKSINSQNFLTLPMKKFYGTLLRKWKDVEEKLEKCFPTIDIINFNKTSTTKTTKTTFIHDLGILIHCEYSLVEFNSFAIYCKTLNNKVFELYKKSGVNLGKESRFFVYLIEPHVIVVQNQQEEVKINFQSNEIEIKCFPIVGSPYLYMITNEVTNELKNESNN